MTDEPRDEKAVGGIVRRGQEPSWPVGTSTFERHVLHHPR